MPSVIDLIRRKQLQEPNVGGPYKSGGGKDEAACERYCRQRGYVIDSPEYDTCMNECFEKQHPKTPKVPGEETPIGCPPESKGSAASGHPECACGGEWNTPTQTCPSGYVFQSKPIGANPPEGTIGRCICEALTHGGGGEGGGAGEQFGWSPDVQALLSRILDRANSLLDRPLGLSDEERQAIYNRIFERIKGTERPAIQSAMNVASRQGLLGSPYAERAITGIQRGTREMLGGAERDIGIEEARRRYEELMGTTGMAQNLLGTGMGAEQMTEALNAARRGEGTTYLSLILQYLSSMMGGQNNSYWQAIMNRLLQQQG